mgnify:CR=1 FL=1
MATTYTSLLGLALPTTGELNGTWGDVVDNYITTFLDSAVAGAQTISGTQTAVTLATSTGTSLVQAGSGSVGSSQYQILNCTGSPASALTITAPATSKVFLVLNSTSTSQTVTVKAAATTGVTVASGRAALIAWNGSDFTLIATNDITKLSGILPVSNGGTGASTAGGALINLGGTSVGTNLLDVSDGFLVASSVFFGWEANDGLVSRCSNHWGQVLRDDYAWNHIDEINHVFGLRGLFSEARQAGDVTAFVPTNVISITDGQIFLETDLFNAGIRPAINAGISVSRVGGAAQTKIMKRRDVGAGVRLALAQYRELAAFAQFASDLDEATRKQLERGRMVTELMKQPQYQPLEVSEMVITLFAVNNGYFDDIEVKRVLDFEAGLHNFLKSSHGALLSKIDDSKALDKDGEAALAAAIAHADIQITIRTETNLTAIVIRVRLCNRE